MDEQNPDGPRPPQPHQASTPPPTFYAGAPSSPTPASGESGESKTRRKVPVGVLLGALVLGTAGGFGGAAVYDTVRDTEPSSGREESSAPLTPVRTDSTDAVGVEAVADAVLASVVRIDVAGQAGAGGGSAGGSGSGIILSADGRILTNAHVVQGAETGGSLRVSFSDGQRAQATVLGVDPLTDTAVIRAEDVDDLTPAAIGESSALKVGQQVVAIGSPFGLDATVTSGIVSALDRPVNVSSDADGNSTTYPAIQTDAAINPGNSGGPLVDMEGLVVGINSSIRTTGSGFGEAGSIGLGFSIPIEPILPIIEQLSAGEPATHARLGITVSDPGVDAAGGGDQLADDAGALVQSVGDDTTAARAGLEAGDLITALDDSPIDSRDDLVATVRTYRPGDEVTVTFLRDGEEDTVELVLDSD